MGLYKLCKHRGRARDTCKHAWWGSFQFKGDLKRTNLETWARESIRTKTKALSVFDRMKEAIRAGRFSGHEDRTDGGPVTFNQLAPVYIERYVKGHDLASVDTIEYRMVSLLDRFGSQRLSEIKQGDIEEFITDLRQPSIVSKGQKTARARMNRTGFLGDLIAWEDGVYGTSTSVFSGSARTCRPDGRGAPGGPRLRVGGAAVGGAEARLHGGDAAEVGAVGAA